MLNRYTFCLDTCPSAERWIKSGPREWSTNWSKESLLPKGLEPLGKRRKVCCRASDLPDHGKHSARAGAPSARSERPARAERAGASESLGRGEGEVCGGESGAGGTCAL